MFSKQNALIIDHDKMSSRTIMRVLKEDLGFKKVIAVGDGKSALNELKKGNIHWVIGEWSMSGMTGKELLKELRSNPKTIEVPFLMLSGRVDRDALMEAISLGVTDFIAKPFTPATISSKVKRLSRIKEKRVASRVNPVNDVVASVDLDDDQRLEGVIINISATGVLISAPRITRGGLNIFDQVKLRIKTADERSILTVSSLVRMECDYDPKYEMGTRILCAFNFNNVDDQNSVLLNSFINEQRGLALSHTEIN